MSEKEKSKTKKRQREEEAAAKTPEENGEELEDYQPAMVHL